MGNETIWENTDNFYLLCQPIMQVESLSQQEVNGYEVLLRSEKNNRFPQQEFSAMIQSESGNQQLMGWYAQELRRLCQKKPKTRFSVNIHPQQLLWQSTWTFFEGMTAHKEQLQIELTEHPVKGQHDSFDLSTAIDPAGFDSNLIRTIVFTNSDRAIFDLDDIVLTFCWIVGFFHRIDFF